MNTTSILNEKKRLETMVIRKENEIKEHKEMIAWYEEQLTKGGK